MALGQRHVGKRLAIYDLRRSFAVGMEDTVIPRSRRKLDLGHSAGDITVPYERRELLAWLEEDGERLREYAGVVLEAMEQRPKLEVA